MKTAIYILIGTALILIIYNATMLDFSHLFKGDSAVAVICILAATCSILLLLILHISLRIKKLKK